MALHKNLTGDNLHKAYAYAYADATARNAASGFVAADIGNLAYQEDTDTLWILTATTPTWQQVDYRALADMYQANAILAADTAQTPASLQIAEQRVVGRITGGTITGLTAAQILTLIGVESGADVTDATNVNAAGAVMESDYQANAILAANDAQTPLSLQIAEDRVVGRITGGTITGLTATQIRTLINVENGATADMSASEILTALLTVDGAGCLLDADLLDGNEASAFALSGHNHSTTYVALAGGTMTGNLTISAAGPTIKWNETDQADDSKLWAAFPYNANWYIQSQTDAGAAVSNILKLGRAGDITIGGASACLILPNASEPTISTNQAGIYVTDQTAGNACIHAKSEAGQIVKLFQGAAVANATDATSTMARLNDLLARMRANGLIAT